MAKAGDRKERERRREAVKGFMALGMGRSEIAEALAKEGFFSEGQVNMRLVERDMRAMRREEARSPKMEYIRRLEEIRAMAMSGQKPDWKVALAVTEKIAKAKGVDTGDVRLTRGKVAQMPRWEAIMRECGEDEEPEEDKVQLGRKEKG